MNSQMFALSVVQMTADALPSPCPALRRHPAHPGCAAPVPTASCPASHGSPIAPKPLEKARRPVQFASIWPTSVLYSDHPRVPLVRPCSTALSSPPTVQARRRRPLAFRAASLCLPERLGGFLGRLGVMLCRASGGARRMASVNRWHLRAARTLLERAAGVEVWKSTNCVAHLSAEARQLWASCGRTGRSSANHARSANATVIARRLTSTQWPPVAGSYFLVPHA